MSYKHGIKYTPPTPTPGFTSAHTADPLTIGSVWIRQVTSIGNAGADINPSTSDIPEMAIAGARVLKRYEEVFKKIGALLAQYQSLVSKDCKRMDDAYNELEGLDQKLALRGH